jgi:branched-chain amino acid transport system substrate-binding protein
MRMPMLCLGLVVALGASSTVRAADTIKIGELDSFSLLPEFSIPYRKGIDLAIEQINASGGVLGKPLEVLYRDDAADAAKAVRIADEYVTRDGVSVLAGTDYSNVALGISDYALHKKMLFVAGEAMSNDLVWAKGNKYTFRIKSSDYMQSAMLAERAAKLPAKRWATVANNFKFGQDAVAAFKEVLKSKRPDVEFVGEQWPGFDHIDAGAIVQALASTKPDAVFNVLFGSQLSDYVRAARDRGFLDNRIELGILTGEPEYLEPLKGDAPPGWIVTGYPWYDIKTPAHTAFLDAYTAKYKDHPYQGSLIGYTLFKAIAAIIQKAGSTDPDKMAAAAEGLGFDAPVGPVTIRALDHQSTMGTYVGTIAVKDGKGVMVDWQYEDGAKYSPSDDVVRKLRP